MRIITGSARGTKLYTLDGESTRPTAERIKEAVFSMLQFDIEGRRILDLFAGSGQLGLEALSRGAAGAVFIDENTEAQKIIKQNAQKTHLYEKSVVLSGEALSYLKHSAGRESFDIIFIDPPYASGLYDRAIALIEQGNILNDGGYAVIESGSQEIVETSLKLLKHTRYGKSYITVLTKEARLEE